MLGLVLLALLSLHCACAEMYVDMTYTFDEKTIRLPWQSTVNITKHIDGKYDAFEWLRIYDVYMSPQIGTMMDAPSFMSRYGRSVDQLEFSQLHGPLVVIDIREKAWSDRNAEVTDKDLMGWEMKYGMIPSGAYVFMNSGWNRFWGDQLKSVGSKNDTAKMSFPGFSAEAAEWLIDNRNINAIGVDTISCDVGKDISFPVHKLIAKENVLCISNVANLDKVRENGMEVFAMPPKMKGAPGFSIRLFAMKKADDHITVAAGSTVTKSAFVSFLSALLALIRMY